VNSSCPDELLSFASKQNIDRLDSALDILKDRRILTSFEESLWQAYPQYAVPALRDLREGLSAVRECRPLKWGECSSISGVSEILSDCINATLAILARWKAAPARKHTIERRLLKPLKEVLSSYPYRRLYDVADNELDTSAWPGDRIRQWGLMQREQLKSPSHAGQPPTL
jgi:hypothetical protein